MIVPQEFLEEVTAFVPPPTRTTKITPTPTPLPTVKPDPIPLIFTQGATETGQRTIWFVVLVSPDHLADQLTPCRIGSFASSWESLRLSSTTSLRESPW